MNIENITIGMIIEAIRDVEEAEASINDAELALSFGGSPQTIKRKHKAISDAVVCLEVLLSKKLVDLQ